MSSQSKIIHRSIGMICLENTLITLSAAALLVISLSVVGLIIVIPMAAGLITSTKNRNPRSFLISSRTAQALIGLLAVAMLGTFVYCKKEVAKSEYKLAAYNDKFEYKRELKISERMSMVDMIQEYGSAEAYRISDINLQHFYATQRLESLIKSNKEMSKNWGIATCIAFLYVFIIEFLWIWPIGNKFRSL